MENTDGQYTEAQCQQDIEAWLNILRERGGQHGAEMERVFRSRDTVFIWGGSGSSGVHIRDQITIHIVDVLPDGGEGGYDNITGEFFFTAGAMRGMRGDQSVAAGVLAHETKHMQQGIVNQPSIKSEIEAYNTQYLVYQALGVNVENHRGFGYVENAERYGHEANSMSDREQLARFNVPQYASLPVYKLLWSIDTWVRGVINNEIVIPPGVLTGAPFG